jgi:hypothetical protein
MIIRRWPVFLGVLLVLILIAFILFALYQTNSFSKMRIYKDQGSILQKLLFGRKLFGYFLSSHIGQKQPIKIQLSFTDNNFRL